MTETIARPSQDQDVARVGDKTRPAHIFTRESISRLLKSKPGPVDALEMSKLSGLLTHEMLDRDPRFAAKSSPFHNPELFGSAIIK
jgi:hypothetical protein